MAFPNLPSTFNGYLVGFGGKSLTLGPHRDDVMLYVSQHSWSSPTIVLHAGPSKSAPTLAGCDLKSLSSNMTLTLNDGSMARSVKSGGWMHKSWTFEAEPGRGLFEWKRTHRRQHNLTELSTGQIVATIDLPTSRGHKVLEFTFVGNSQQRLGPVWATAAVATALGVLTQVRRQTNSAAAAGGAAGGAGGGGGGC